MNVWPQDFSVGPRILVSAPVLFRLWIFLLTFDLDYSLTMESLKSGLFYAKTTLLIKTLEHKN